MAAPSDFVPSKASVLKKQEINFESVSFQSYKPKRSREITLKPGNISTEQQNQLNMKQAKHEIIKLGMSGLDPQQKEEAKINLLIKLGAKVPKNKGKNYKQLQLERKKKKDEESKRLNFAQLGKNMQGKSTAKGKSFDRKRRKEKGDILSIYGKVRANING